MISGFFVGVDGTLSPVPGSPHPSGVTGAATFGLAITPNSGPLAAFTMQVYRRGAPRFVLAIGDCGIGIRASLSTNPKYSYTVPAP